MAVRKTAKNKSVLNHATTEKIVSEITTFLYGLDSAEAVKIAKQIARGMAIGLADVSTADRDVALRLFELSREV